MCTAADVVAKIVAYSDTDTVIGGYAPQLAAIAPTRAEVEQILEFHATEALECMCTTYWGNALCKAAALKAAYTAAEAYPAAAQGAGVGGCGGSTGAAVTSIKEGDLSISYAATKGDGSTALASSLMGQYKALRKSRAGRGPRFILGGC